MALAHGGVLLFPLFAADIDKEFPMVPTMSLWMPIRLSAVLVFVVSSIIHIVLTYHRTDFGRVPSEDESMEGPDGGSGWESNRGTGFTRYHAVGGRST